MKLFISRAVLFLGIAVFTVSQPALASRHGMKHPHRVHRKKDGHSPVKHHPYKTHRRHTAASRPAPRAAIVRAHHAITRKKLSESPQACPVALLLPQKSQPALSGWTAAVLPVVTQDRTLESPESEDVAFTTAVAEPAAPLGFRTAAPNASIRERPAAPSPLRTVAPPSDVAAETESAPLRIRPVYPATQSRVAPEKDNRPPVTLVYKDGRAEKVLNYLLSPTLLCILDGNRDSRYRDVPVEELDLEATEKANQAVGIDFALPKIPE
jgi:hypothetical protein